MNHNKYELTYKAFVKAKKRLDKVYELLRRVPNVKLKEPYQSGWIISITLREDFLRSEKGGVVKSLIERFRVDDYTRNPKIVSQLRKKPALSDARTILMRKFSEFIHYHGPHIRSLNNREYDSLQPYEKKYFDFSKGYTGTKYTYVYRDDRWDINIPYHYLVVKVTKRMITHAYELDTQLLSEKAELWKTLAPYYRTCNRGYGWEHRFENRSERRQSKVETREITKRAVEYHRDYDL